jgi:signal transduction histidine kinase/CheY-like chemotaxis protein
MTTAIERGAGYSTEYRLRHKDGHYVYVWDQGLVMRGPSGRPARVIGSTVDITRRKQAEEEIARLLAQEQAARALAEEANRAKDEFLAVVTHELRSPLNAMLGYARLFSAKPALGEAEARQAFEVIKRSGERQKELIDDLLDTARIITGKLRLDARPINLVAVINDALDAARLAAKAKNIALAAKLDAQAGQITGDSERLQQVVWNLVNNAIKFTPGNGRVEIELKRDGPRIVIAVSDTGKGIAPEFLPHVFERFTQQDASRTRRHGGLGLGLALVKHLVELHGGTIQASSPGEGHGATFTINLPIRAVSGQTESGRAGERESGRRGDGETRGRGDRESKGSFPPFSPTPPLPHSPTPPLSGLWALVVDDEDDARELVSRVLSDHGARVTAVSSAAEAWATITDQPRETRLGALVIDIGLPEEDGYSLMRRIREWERGHNGKLQAIALTAYGRSQDRVQALMAGFQMHVPKPVEPEELVAVIKSLVGEK